MPSMMSRRSSCGVATLDSMLYVVGGNDGSLCMSSVEKFDFARNAWETVASMNSRRYADDTPTIKHLTLALPAFIKQEHSRGD